MWRRRAGGAWLAVFLLPALASGQQLFIFRDGSQPTPAYSGTRDLQIASPAEVLGTPETHYWSPTTAYYRAYNADAHLGGVPWQHAVLTRWQLAPTLAAGDTVQAARLELYVDEASTDTFAVYALARPFVEYEATWQRASVATAWASPGALGVGTDYGSTQLGSFAPTPIGWVQVPLNAAGVAVVQGWVNNSATNFGLAIRNDAATDAASYVGAESNNVSSRARLVVTYNGGTVARFQNGVQPNAAYAGANDTFIANGPDPRTLNWNGIGLEICGANSPNNQSALLKFDISSLPAGTLVLDAGVQLAFADATTGPYPLYELLADWVETEATWFQYRDGGAWAAPGAQGAADRGNTPLATITNISAGQRAIALNMAGVQLVQAWVNGSKPNRGFIFQNYSVSDTTWLPDREDTVVGSRPALLVVVQLPDGGVDAGMADGGPVDGGVDAGPSDAGVLDGGTDAGGNDAGGVDSGLVDGGPDDGGTTDAGAPDGGALGGDDAGSPADGGFGGRLGESYVVGCSCDGGGPFGALLLIGLWCLRARRGRRPVGEPPH